MTNRVPFASRWVGAWRTTGERIEPQVRRRDERDRPTEIEVDDVEVAKSAAEQGYPLLQMADRAVARFEEHLVHLERIRGRFQRNRHAVQPKVALCTSKLLRI